MLRRGVLPLSCGAALLVAFALRVAGLGAQSLWYDEGFSVLLARQSIPEIARLTAGDIHPPLYYFLLHGWLQLAGSSEFTLRFLSLLPSVLSVVVVARLAGRAGPLAAAAGALLAAVAPAAVWYGQETRMYALLVTLVGLSLDRFLAFLEQRGRPFLAWSGWVLATVLAAWAHFYGLFVVAAEVLVATGWLLGRRRAVVGPGLALAAGMVLVALAYLPWLGPATTRLDADESYYQGTLSLIQVLRETATLLAVGSTLDGPLATLGLGLFWLSVGVGAWAWRRRPLGAVLLVLAAVVPLFLLLAVSWNRPKFHPRYLLVTLPAVQALAATGLAWFLTVRPRLLRPLGSGVAAALALSLAASLLNAATDPRYARDDWRAVAAVLQPGPRDAVALISGHAFPVFTYYYHGPYTPLPDGFTLSTRATLGYNLATTLNDLAARAERLWVVRWQDDVVDPNGVLDRLLATGADREPLAAALHGVALERYRFRPGAHFAAEPAIRHPLQVEFEGVLTLLGYDEAGEAATPLALPAASQRTLTFYWQAKRPLTGDYKVAMRLVDERGVVWGRVDRRPAAYFYPTWRWKPGEIVFGDLPLPLAPTTPPGQYWLEVELYREEGSQLQPLNVLDALGNRAGQAARVATLTVLPPQGQQPAFTLPRPLAGDLGPVLLRGTDLPEVQPARPGSSLVVSAYLQRAATASPTAALRLRVERPNGELGMELLVEPIAGYPVTLWPTDWTWRAAWLLQLPATLTSGEWVVRLAGPSGVATLLRLTVAADDRSFTLPDRLPNRLDLAFGEVATLRGWEIGAGAVQPGETLRVRLVWQAQGPSTRPLKRFLHLVDPSGRVVTQQDAPPGEDRWPTSGWLAGQVITDQAELALPVDLPAGEYQLAIGLYDPQSGARVPVAGSDHWRLATVRVG